MDEQGNKAYERQRSCHEGLDEWMDERGLQEMNGQDLIAWVKSRDGQWRSYRGEKKCAETRERVSKAVSSFSCTLQTISSISKFHAISLTARHVAQENHFYHVLLGR